MEPALSQAYTGTSASASVASGAPDPPGRDSMSLSGRTDPQSAGLQRQGSGSESASLTSPTVLAAIQASYMAPPLAAPSDPDTNAAAIRIQTAWRAYRQCRNRSFCEFGATSVRLMRCFLDTGSFQPDAPSRAHLILHFDVNKTILMSDAVKGLDQEGMVNMLLAACAWGRMTIGPRWVPVGRLATDRSCQDPQLMTYRNFVDSFLYPQLLGSSEETLQENARRKRLCASLQRRFTAAGEPGEMFRGVFTALQEQLRQPEDATRHPLFAAGQRRILPSFFELLLYLQREQRTFTLVFRTFGTDLREVIQEINLFAEGQHPCYPGVRMDGSDGLTDIRIREGVNTGAFIRWGLSAKESLLALGVDNSVLEAKQMSREAAEASVTEHDGAVAEGFDAIFRAFQTLAEPVRQWGSPRRTRPGMKRGASEYVNQHRHTPNCALAIRDCYQFWRSRNERATAGKLLLVNTHDPRTIQVFFDDNIGISSAKIADARDSQTGLPIPFMAASGAHLIRAEPVHAILDPLYFVRAVNEAELKVLRTAELHWNPAVKLAHATAQHDCKSPASTTSFSGGAMGHLRRAGISTVARVSLAAKKRWESALRQVLMMIKVVRAFRESV